MILDLLLASTLIVLVWYMFTSPGLFRFAFLYITFGLLVSIVWLRLDAPDVAMAEAAVGDGLTGALLLFTLIRMRRIQSGYEQDESEEQDIQHQEDDDASQGSRSRKLGVFSAKLFLRSNRKKHLVDDSFADDDIRFTPARVGILLSAFLLTCLAIFAVLTIPQDMPRLLDLTQLKLIESGVKNPVTAVLINYRGYDTFLEVSVLLLALIALWSVAPHRKHMPLRIPKTLILNSFVKMMTPLIVVCAGYFLWIGGDSPGGAFQAGSVLGGIGVLAVASSIRQPGTRLRMLMRLLLVLGLLFFVIDAVTMMVLGGEMLEYSSGHQAKIWILIVEGSATISIGLSLVMFFVGGQPEAPVEDEQQSEGVK